MAFADKLEKATLQTIESGYMTKDLTLLTTLTDIHPLNTRDFLKKIAENLNKLI